MTTLERSQTQQWYLRNRETSLVTLSDAYESGLDRVHSISMREDPKLVANLSILMVVFSGSRCKRRRSQELNSYVELLHHTKPF